MWFEFFIIGGVWFWILAAVVAMGLISSLVEHQGFNATIWVIVFLALVHVCGNAQWYIPFAEQPWFAAKAALAYVLLGLAWSFIRLWIWGRDKRAEYDANLTDDRYYYSREPMFSDVIGHIATWIMYWPLSIVAYVLGEIPQRLSRAFSVAFKSIYVVILKNAFGQITFEKEKP